MFEIQGKYGKAAVMTDNCDNETLSQIYEITNQQVAEKYLRSINPE